MPDADRTLQTPPPTELEGRVEIVDRAPWLALLEERFGIPPAVFDDYVLFRTSNKYLSIAARDHRPPARPAPTEVGIAFLRTNLRYPKLTTGAALLFGRAATRNVVALDRSQAERFLDRESLLLRPEQAAACTGLGYVLVRHREAILGLGLFTEGPAGARVDSLYPKAWSRV